MDPRTRRTGALAVVAALTVAASAAALIVPRSPALLHYLVSAALFLTALFFGSGAYAAWTGQIGDAEPARDRED